MVRVSVIPGVMWRVTRGCFLRLRRRRGRCWRGFGVVLVMPFIVLDFVTFVTVLTRWPFVWCLCGYGAAGWVLAVFLFDRPGAIGEGLRWVRRVWWPRVWLCVLS